jgi:nucleoside-diphosphate-sugar epimerase
MKNRKIFVTGGSGFIGSSVVRSLVENGDYVTVLDNNSRGSLDKLANIKGDFNFIEGDVRDESNFKDLGGYDCIVHLAYVNGTKYFYEIPYDILDIGINGMINVMNSIKKFNIESLVLASTSEVYQLPPKIPTNEDVPLVVPDILNPRYSYGGGKIASELLAVNFAKQFDLDLKIFRPHNVYGPNMGYEHVIPEIINKVLSSNDGKVFMQGDGSDTRAFIFIDDFIQAFKIVMNDSSDEMIFHIGNMEEISILEIYKKIISFSGKNIELTPGDRPLGATNRRCPDNSRIRSLGYNQKISIDQGIQLTFDWYQNNHKEN